MGPVKDCQGAQARQEPNRVLVPQGQTLGDIEFRLHSRLLQAHESGALKDERCGFSELESHPKVEQGNAKTWEVKHGWGCSALPSHSCLTPSPGKPAHDPGRQPRGAETVSASS